MIGVIVLPLVLAGPEAVDQLLPARLDFLNQLYWPVVTILSAGFLNTLYHVSVPVRTPWVSDLPGAFLALSIWILGSFVLRWVLQSTVGGTSIYGPLAAPIAVLMWLYMTDDRRTDRCGAERGGEPDLAGQGAGTAAAEVRR